MEVGYTEHKILEVSSWNFSHYHHHHHHYPSRVRPSLTRFLLV